MHGVILAAGEGSRMGERTDDVPKAFMEVGGRSLYARQRAAIDPLVDDVTVVLGHAAENVLDRLDDVRPVVFEDWRQYENGESLRRAIADVSDDVLVLNGDVVVAPRALRRLAARHRQSSGESLVGCYPGTQTDHTAVRTDDRGRVTDYGRLEGRRHAGVGILDRTDLDAAERTLARNRSEWYPVVYPRLGARAVTVEPRDHVEINRPDDVDSARDRFPMVGRGDGPHVRGTPPGE